MKTTPRKVIPYSVCRNRKRKMESWRNIGRSSNNYSGTIKWSFGQRSPLHPSRSAHSRSNTHPTLGHFEWNFETIHLINFNSSNDWWLNSCLMESSYQNLHPNGPRLSYQCQISSRTWQNWKIWKYYQFWFHSNLLATSPPSWLSVVPFIHIFWWNLYPEISPTRGNQRRYELSILTHSDAAGYAQGHLIAMVRRFPTELQ